ncbi:MAG: hypothetical protein HXS52_06095 [Theionarchaea archaeon]|nr:hypothetical protein [Theionarchaea archaeon]MBU7037482.1 hypothetical protein [Theionarchaea archaeon]
MPFTPFHWGPTSLIGLAGFQRVDFATLLTTTTLIDLEPLVVLGLSLDYPAHGLFHSFVGSSPLALITACVMYAMQDGIRGVTTDFGLQQCSSFEKVLGSSFFGLHFHIVIDSLIYREITAFYPFKRNPLYLVSPIYMYLFCGGTLLASVLLYTIRCKHLR